MKDHYIYPNHKMTLFISDRSKGDTRFRIENYFTTRANDYIVLILDTNTIEDCYDYSDLHTWDIDLSKVIPSGYWVGEDVTEAEIYSISEGFMSESSKLSNSCIWGNVPLSKILQGGVTNESTNNL